MTKSLNETIPCPLYLYFVRGHDLVENNYVVTNPHLNLPGTSCLQVRVVSRYDALKTSE